MQNELIFDINGGCICACVANIHNGCDKIKLIYEGAENQNSDVEVMKPDGESEFISLFKFDDYSAGDFPLNLLQDGTKFRYEGGIWFDLVFVPPNDTPVAKTLKVTYDGSSTFTYTYASAGTTVNEETGETEEVNVEVNDVLKSLAVTTDQNDLVTNVTFNYEKTTTTTSGGIEEETVEEYSTNYSIEYDSNDNVIKFGDIEVMWQ